MIVVTKRCLKRYYSYYKSNIPKIILFISIPEIPIPLRFVFIVLTPKSSPNMDCHEVGRAFSTLMSNKFFHDICYSFEAKEDLLIAINMNGYVTANQLIKPF